MKIYTKTGDKGLTSLFDGTRVKKFHPRVEAYGTVDELNSTLGMITAEIKKDVLHFRKTLEVIQHDLLDIGSRLADPQKGFDENIQKKLTSHTATFEKFIDEMTAKMPTLNNFILPGGGRTGSLLHMARSIVRRAERRVVELSEKNNVEKEIIVYLNRLSDLFFTMSRFVNFREKRKETIWTKE